MNSYKTSDQYIVKENSDGTIITVADVHKVLLQILKDIDKVCQKHNITYWLNGGSALGAVRHKGFIPWDDDADIGMMEDDFFKFEKIIAQELGDGYAIHSYDLDDRYNVMIPGMKIRKKGTYIKEVNWALPNRISECDGLFVDVFVYDYINPDKTKDFLNRIPMYLLSPFIEVGELIHVNPKIFKKAFMNHARKYGEANRGSEYIGFDLTWLFKSPTKPFVFKKEDIIPTQYVTFEDTMLPIAHNPHNYLCMAIADSYMTIPDEKDQICKHTKDIQL